MASGLLHHLARVFIASQANKLRVPQIVGSDPFQKLYLRHSFWIKPNGLFHLLCRASLTPIVQGPSQVDSRTGTSLFSGA